MASITNVRLEVARDGSVVEIRVTYSLKGSWVDAIVRRSYREIVELIGDDERPGEDGRNDLIPRGLVHSGQVRFEDIAAIPRTRSLSLRSDDLDEDSSADPRTALLSGDEIRARVTLARFPPKPVRASSGIVFFGAPLIAVPSG